MDLKDEKENSAPIDFINLDETSGGPMPSDSLPAHLNTVQFGKRFLGNSYFKTRCPIKVRM